MSALSTPATARDGFPAFAGLMRRLASRAAPWPAEIADAIAWLNPLIETRYDGCCACEWAISRRLSASPQPSHHASVF